jgi:hypothetical protein
MKIKLISLIALLFFACNSKIKSFDFLSVEQEQKGIIDTIVVGKTILSGISSPSYRKKEYFVTIEKDTSIFSCIFLENNINEKIRINFDYDAYKKYSASYSDSIPVIEKKRNTPCRKITYKQQINELSMILKKSLEDFDLNKVQYICFELSSTGDLAINITNQYMKSKEKNHKYIEQILLNSQFYSDINSVFKPYSIAVEQIFIEKFFFISKENFYETCKIETEAAKIPDKILDCMVYVEMKKKTK